MQARSIKKHHASWSCDERYSLVSADGDEGLRSRSKRQQFEPKLTPRSYVGARNELMKHDETMEMDAMGQDEMERRAEMSV